MAEIPRQKRDILQMIQPGRESRRSRKVILAIRIGRLEQEIGGSDAGAAAAQISLRVAPVGDGVAGLGDVIAVTCRVVFGVVEKLGQLLGQRLNVLISDDARYPVEVTPEYEGVTGRAIDPVRAGGAADRGVAVHIVSRVMGDGDDQGTVLPGHLTEELFLEIVDVDHGYGSTGSFRSKQIAGAGADVDSNGLHLWPAKQGMPVRCCRRGRCSRERGPQKRIGVLGVFTGSEREGRENRRSQDALYISVRADRNGLTTRCPGRKTKRDRHKQDRQRGGAAERRVSARQRDGMTRAGPLTGPLISRHGALRLELRQRRETGKGTEQKGGKPRLHTALSMSRHP